MFNRPKKITNDSIDFSYNRNDYLQDRIIIFNREKSKKIFAEQIRNDFFHDNMVESVNSFFEELGIRKRISKIGENQKVICIELGKFIKGGEENFFFLFIILIGGVVFMVGDSGITLLYALEYIVGAFSEVLSFIEEDLMKLLKAVERAHKYLALEDRRTYKKFYKFPEFIGDIKNIFFRNDNFKEYSIFIEKVKKSMEKIENKELYIDLVFSKVRGRLEGFQILKDRNEKGWFIIKRMKNGDSFRKKNNGE